MYAVTGASGQLGRHVIDSLLERGVPAGEIAAVVRTPSKIADIAERGVVVRAGDYGDPSSWSAALTGVDTLLLISSSENGQRVPQHTVVIEAAKSAGVQRIAYTSILNADTTTIVLAPEHLATEGLLRNSGLAYTILRNGWYFENYLGQADQYVAQGAIVSAAGLATFSPAARADYAAAAAATLVDDGHENAIYELGGDDVTMADIADAIAKASGKTVDYRQVGPEQLREGLVAAHLPEQIVDMVVDIDRSILAGELATDSHDLARLTGKPLTTLSEAADATLRPSHA